MFWPDCTFTIAGYRQPFHGPDAVVRWADSYHRGFECRLTVEEAAAEGPNVLVRWMMHAFHRGEYLGMPATHHEIAWRALQWSQFDGEKIRNVWVLLDTQRLAQDLGFLPQGRFPRVLGETLAWRQRVKNRSRKGQGLTKPPAARVS